MLHEMASQALSVPEIFTILCSSAVVTEGGKAFYVLLLPGGPYLIKC